MVKPMSKKNKISHGKILDALIPSLKKFGYTRKDAKKIITLYVQVVRYAMGTLRPVTLPCLGTLKAKPYKKTENSPLYKIEPEQGGFNLRCYFQLSLEGRLWVRKAIRNYNYVLDDGTMIPKKGDDKNVNTDI